MKVPISLSCIKKQLHVRLRESLRVRSDPLELLDHLLYILTLATYYYTIDLVKHYN